VCVNSCDAQLFLSLSLPAASLQGEAEEYHARLHEALRC
jgi:hypothetical protein